MLVPRGMLRVIVSTVQKRAHMGLRECIDGAFPHSKVSGITVGVFTPWKSAHSKNQAPPNLLSWLVNLSPALGMGGSRCCFMTDSSMQCFLISVLFLSFSYAEFSETLLPLLSRSKGDTDFIRLFFFLKLSFVLIL